MAKKVLKISDFGGGLNSYSDGKDIKDNEFQALDNAEVDENGIIRVSGGISRDIVLNNYSQDSFRLSSNMNPGTGLYSFFSDYSSTISYWSSDIYNYDLDTTNFDNTWSFISGDGTGWVVSDSSTPKSQTVGVPRCYINGKASISDVSGATATPSNLGSIMTSEILLKSNTEYTLKFKAMCAGTDSWFYSAGSVPPHVKIHDLSLSNQKLILFSNDGTGYTDIGRNPAPSNFLTNEQANMFATSVGGWTAIGSTAPTLDDADADGAEIKEYIGNSTDIKSILVESDGNYTPPSYLQTTTSGNFGAKSEDISGADTVHGFLPNASYYLDVMCINDDGSNKGDPIVEVRWKDGSDYKVLYSKRFPQRTEWSHINISDYNGFNLAAPNPNTSFKSIEFKLPSDFDTANDKLQIRVGCHGDGNKASFTGFNLRRATNELGNVIKAVSSLPEFESYPVSYNMTYNSLLFAQETSFERRMLKPREYRYKFITNNHIYETHNGENYVKLKFEFVAGKWGCRTSYSNLEFYFSDISIIGAGGINHTLAFSEYFPNANMTNLSLSHYSKDGYSQTDKSILPLSYSGNAFIDFNYVNGRLILSDGNFQNSNKSYQYYYNQYINSFVLSKTNTSPPRIFNFASGSYNPYTNTDRMDVLQEYMGASVNNDLNIFCYASNVCQNNSWGVIDANTPSGQEKNKNQVDMLISNKFDFNVAADTDGGGSGVNGGGGGAKKRIIISQDKLTGKTDDIANIYIRLKVYALIGTARDVQSYYTDWQGQGINSPTIDFNMPTPWYTDKKIKISYDVKGWSNSDYTIDADTDPHAIGSIPTVITSDNLDTPNMDIETNEQNSTTGWFTELDVNATFEEGMTGLAGPIGNEGQDGYPRRYISCIVEKNLNYSDSLISKDNNLMLDISLDTENLATNDHRTRGDITYNQPTTDSGEVMEPTLNPPNHVYTLASGISALHINIEECNIDFHSGSTTNSTGISEDDVGVYFTFTDSIGTDDIAEGWKGSWTIAVTTVNIHGEESYLRKTDIGSINCDLSTKAPEIALCHNVNLNTSEIKYFKVYASYSDSEIYYLQMTCDVKNKKCWSSTGGTTLHANYSTDSLTSSWVYITPAKENLNPNEVLSYESETQVSQEDAESEQRMTAQYKCSVVANNHLYVGNIKQDGLIQSDAMIKSPEGKPGILPSTNKITVVANDGDEIIALHYFKDKLLQFKKERVFVIGTDEGDYLDEILENVGINSKSQVITSTVGIFWINQNGCYGYDGKKLTNFTEGKIARKKWKETISNWLVYDFLNPSIGYLKHENKLIIWPSTYNTSVTKALYPADYSGGLSNAEKENLQKVSTNEYGYIYDLDNNRWSMIYKGVDGESLPSTLESSTIGETSRMYGLLEDSYNKPVSNFSYDIHDNMIWGVGNDYGFKVYKWDDSPSATSGVEDNEREFRVITKDFDFGNPSINKKIYKVYVTFKSSDEPAIVTNRKQLSVPFYKDPNIKVYYSVNGDNLTWTEFSQTKSKNYNSNGLSVTLLNNSLQSDLSYFVAQLTESKAQEIFGSNYSTILKNGNILKINEEIILVQDWIWEGASFYKYLYRGHNNTQAEDHISGNSILLQEKKWFEAELKPATSINNVKSISFKFASILDDGKPVPKGFSINDISVLYRLKRAK